MNTGFSKSNSRIQDGSIYNSSIDMNNGIIHNHNMPVVNLDVVNKIYCDNNSRAGVPFFNITLSGLVWTTILATQEGVIELFVKNGMSGGPCGSFQLSKNSPNRQASIIRWNSCAGSTTEERLQIRWLPNTGIELRKNGTGYDGTYTIKYIEN